MALKHKCVCVGSSLSDPWFDSSIAQHLVLSPLLLMLPADSLLDLQDALDAVSELELQMALYLWQLLQTNPHSWSLALVSTSPHAPSFWPALCRLLSMASWWASRFTWRLALCLNSTLAVRLMDGALWVHQTLRFSSNLVRRPAPLRRTIVVSLSWAPFRRALRWTLPFARAYLPHCPLHPAFTIVPLCPTLLFIGCSPLHNLRHWPSLSSTFVSKPCFRLTRHSPLVAGASSFRMDPCFPWPAPDCLWALLLGLRPVSRGHPGLSLSYTLGEASSGYFFSCLLECLALSTVVSCVLPNTTLHSARLIPRPYLVCWAGLRAFCLAVTISSRFPGSLFPRQEGEDCRIFSRTNPIPATNWKSGHATKCQDHQLCQECCDCSCGWCCRCCWCRCCGRNRNNADGYARGDLWNSLCVFVSRVLLTDQMLVFWTFHHRSNVRLVNDRCAVCVVQHPSLLDGPVQMLLGFVHGLFGISVRNFIWCKSVTRSSPHNFLLWKPPS